MAFDPKEFANQYRAKTASTFDPQEFAKKYIQQNVGGIALSQFSKDKTSTSTGLYNLAVQSGLQKEADRILAQKGENSRQIFSGGVVSDIFDVLNTLQYGMVGMLKGKSFSEGVKTRASFSDKDSLGKAGLVGIIGGLLLDIAVDPLTYISPLTIAKKIPAVIKGISVASKAAETSRIGKFLGEKFVWMFGADPIFKESYERMVKNIVVGDMNIGKLVQGIIDLPEAKAAKLLKKDKTGRFVRESLDNLKDILTDDEMFNVAKSFSVLDDLGKEAVDLGLLSQGKWEENVGEYIKSAYEKYEKKEGAGLFGTISNKIKGIKGRKDLTPEQMAELGQIKNPSFLLFKSMVDLNHDVETAKLFKLTAERFGSDVAQEGFEKMPLTQRFVTTAGKQSGILTEIKKVNQEIKPTIKELEKVFYKDKETLSLIKNIEKTIEELSGKRAEELTKFFQAPLKAVKTVGGKQIIRGVGKLPDNLKEIGDAIKKFDNFSDLMKSNIGIELEKLFENGVLERAGFAKMEDLFEFVKNSYKKIPEVTKEITQMGSLPKVVKLQKQIEELTPKLSNLKEIDKKSIDDAYRYFEDKLNTLSNKKETLVGELDATKLTDLAGKYVPKPIWNYLNEINESKNASEKLLSKVVGEFKFNKVILNPATHARNVVSNIILNYWKLGMNPITASKYYAEAAQNIAKGSGRLIDQAKAVGYGLDSFAANELKDTLLDGTAKGIGGAAKKIRDKLAGIYQGEENFAKLAAFGFNMDKGMAAEAAWKAAESATFNYAQVTTFVRKLRQSIWGFPFITFTVKATPVAAETILKHPARVSVIGKIKNSIEQMADIEETQKERANEPAWIRNGFYVKLPMKDEKGRSAYFDLTYIIPFGDLVSGQFLEGQISRETGIEEGVGQSALRKNPTINFIREIARNEDFYGDKIWQESDTQDQQLKDLFRHLSKTYLPPLVADQIEGGWVQQGEAKGTRRQKGIAGALSPEQEANQQRTLMEEMLSQVGMKIQPIDLDIQETYMEWEKKKALETMLKERGVLDEFSKTYIPKD